MLDTDLTICHIMYECSTNCDFKIKAYALCLVETKAFDLI